MNVSVTYDLTLAIAIATLTIIVPAHPLTILPLPSCRDVFVPIRGGQDERASAAFPALLMDQRATLLSPRRPTEGSSTAPSQQSQQSQALRMC